MSLHIPSDFMDLFNKKTFGVLTTLNPDNSPQSTVIWIDYKKNHILFNSIKKRQKYKNIKNDPRVSLVLLDPNDNYRYLEIRGRVEKITTKNARQFVDRLAQRYLGKEEYPHHRPGVTRVIYWLKPTYIRTYGK